MTFKTFRPIFFNASLGFLITAGVQLPGYCYVILTLERPMFGRKRSICIFLILSGLALCTHPFVPKQYPAIRITISVIGRFAANCSYTILQLYSAELFPTVVRGKAGQWISDFSGFIIAIDILTSFTNFLKTFRRRNGFCSSCQ